MNTDFLSSIKSFFQQKKIQEIISLSVILSAAFFSVFVILHNAEWILGDNYSFILTTAQGKPAPLLNNINIGHGRFFPLAGLDFNLLLLIPGGTSAFAHYLYVSFTFLVAYLFYFLFNKEIFAKSEQSFIKNNALLITSFSCLLLVTSGGFFIVFMNVIFSERLIFLLFALMMYSFLKGRNNGKNFWFSLAAISAIYAAYLKETIPPALFAFSFFSLIFFRKEMQKAEKYAHYAIIANFMVFMAMWLYFSQYGKSETYQPLIMLPFAKMIKTVLWHQAILILILAMAFYRFCAIMFFKAKPVYQHDPLLFASAVLICEYIVLKFAADYYYFPAEALGIPSLLYFIFSLKDLCFKENPKRRIIFVATISVLLIFSVYNGISESSVNIRHIAIERAKVMPAMRIMAKKFLKGGKIYWITLNNGYIALFDLTKLYVNFVLKQEMGQSRSLDDSIIEPVNTIPELSTNDVVLYEVLHRMDFDVSPEALAALHRQGFDLCQYQAGYLMFTKGKCGL